MCISMLHSLFVTFFIDYVLQHELHSKAGDANATMTYFAIGQVFYAICNAANDLGFGWIGDTVFTVIAHRRVDRIRFGGPLWAASFAVLWWPLQLPLHPAIQFTLLMILYDTFFSLTTVSFRALLTDTASSSREREKCNASAAIFHLIGSSGVVFATFFYNENSKDGHGQFRVFMTFWALAAGSGFLLFGKRTKETELSPTTSKEGFPARGLWGFATQTLSRRSMRVAAGVWAVQEYSCTFASNFFNLFVAVACADLVSPLMRSAVLFLSFVLPHFFTVAVTPLLPTVGKKTVIAAAFGLRVVLGISILSLTFARDDDGSISRGARSTFMWQILLNRVLTEVVCRLQPLVLSDLTDEDTVTFARPHSMAAAMHGLVSVTSKPFQSVAPVVTCYILAAHGIILDDMQPSGRPQSGHIDVLVHLVGTTVVGTSAAMLVVWLKWYDLDGPRLLRVQSALERRVGSLQEV